MKILQIIHSAYRATIEEQDDTVLWLTHAMTAAGGDFDLLLCGNAVNYTLTAQDAEGLCFGDWKQTQPPRIARDVESLIGKGVKVYAVTDDAAEIGIDQAERVDGVRPIARSELAGLYEEYQQVWRW